MVMDRGRRAAYQRYDRFRPTAAPPSPLADPYRMLPSRTNVIISCTIFDASVVPGQPLGIEPHAAPHLWCHSFDDPNLTGQNPRRWHENATHRSNPQSVPCTRINPCPHLATCARNSSASRQSKEEGLLETMIHALPPPCRPRGTAACTSPERSSSSPDRSSSSPERSSSCPERSSSSPDSSFCPWDRSMHLSRPFNVLSRAVIVPVGQGANHVGEVHPSLPMALCPLPMAPRPLPTRKNIFMTP